jgi:hypothetical protein
MRLSRRMRTVKAGFEYIRSDQYTRPLILRDTELGVEALGPHLAHVLARAAGTRGTPREGVVCLRGRRA